LATALTAGATQPGKTLISANLIKDGDKSYPEILDYHPEKKVSTHPPDLKTKDY
jgi:hypothetical protein